MPINMQKYLQEFARTVEVDYAGLTFADICLRPERIKAVMVNEVVPPKADDYFYNSETGDMLSVKMLLQAANLPAFSAKELLAKGIYLTAAIKHPKKETGIKSEVIKQQLIFLEQELKLFPNLQALMLMGDIAKKAFNLLVKKQTGRNFFPAGSTYKQRLTESYWGQIRIFPSYIMTGKNILIEKSKREMIKEDILAMLKLLN